VKDARIEEREHNAEWLYRGIWKVVSKAFKVPESPPELPSLPQDTLRTFQPSRRFLDYLKLYFWVGAIVFGVPVLVLWLGSFIVKWQLGVILTIPVLVLVVLPNIVGYVAIHLRYDTTWYVMNARSLRCRRGIWVIVEHTITFENVQNIHIRRGPLQYLFGISTIVIETAGASESGESSRFSGGNKAILEGLENPDEIRELIMERVRRSRGTGIGELPGEEVPAGSMWRPDHIRRLREIKEEIAGCSSRY
jgi:membrane protein YdbS with pleckstrin-like domain